MTDRFRLAAVVAIEIGIKGRVPTSMTEDEIYAEFAHLGIARETLEHPAVFTVDDSAFVHRQLPGAHTKNLFLKDNRGEYWLVVLPSDRRADLKGIAEIARSGKLSFAKPEDMLRLLGVEPGSVTPLGAVNAPIGSVHVIFDRSFRSPVPIAIHPLRNTATIAVPFDRLVDWLVAKGVDVRELSLP